MIYIDSLLLKYPGVDYIFHGKNLGYGYANNIAIKKYQKQTKYHVVLNPDVEFDEDVLSGLYNKLENDLNIGLAGVKILNPDGVTQYVNKKLPKPFDVTIRLIGKKIPIIGRLIKKIFRRSRNSYKLKDLDHNKDIICPAISGCFMFFRSSALKDIGLFDPRYFMYYDDVDISRRCFAKYKVIIFNKVSVIHHWERGSYKCFGLFLSHLNSTIKYFNKWGWFIDKQRKILNSEVEVLDD